MSVRSFVVRLVAVFVALMLCAAPALGAASTTASMPGAARSHRSVQRLARGLTLTRISEKAAHQQIRVLTLTPSKGGPTVDVTLAGGRLGHFAKTSAMAKKAHAIAAVNGDFAAYPGRPFHAFLEDGKLVQSAIRPGEMFGIGVKTDKVHIGRAAVHMRGIDQANGHTFSVAEVNTGLPGANDIAGYTPVASDVETPPGNACAARLVPAGALRWGPGTVGLQRTYKVDVQRCSGSSLPVGGGIVIAALQSSATAADKIRALDHGDSINLSWSLGWPGVMDAIGGRPQLVHDGKVVSQGSCHSAFCRPQPRTGIGVTKAGKVLMVTVDGRSKAARGMALEAFAKKMRALGAVEALNLDGGGGTTMWTKKSGLVNDPSDVQGERHVNTAIVVLPHRDKHQPKPH